MVPDSSVVVRLRGRGGFTRCRVCAEANREYRMTCFPVFTFMDECTELAGAVKVKDQ